MATYDERRLAASLSTDVTSLDSRVSALESAPSATFVGMARWIANGSATVSLTVHATNNVTVSLADSMVDTGGAVTYAAPEYTIVTAGTYRVELCFHLSGSSTAVVFVERDTGSGFAQLLFGSGGGSARQSGQVFWIGSLAAGDKLRIVGRTTSGSASSLISSTAFMVRRIA